MAGESRTMKRTGYGLTGISLVCFFLCWLASFSYASELILHWKFDDSEEMTEVDASLKGNHGVLERAGDQLPFPERVPNVGLFTSALRLQNRSSITSEKPLQLGDAWTLSFWMRQERFQPTVRNFISGPLHLDIPDRPDEGIRVGTQERFSIEGLGQLRSNRITPGDWEHVVVVIKPGEAALYLNGRLEAQAQNPDWRYDLEPAPLRFHRDSSNPFVGLIDEVRVYRGALTDAEIENLAQGVYHPQAAWIAGYEPSMQELIHAGWLSQARAEYLRQSGAPDLAKLRDVLAGNEVSWLNDSGDPLSEDAFWISDRQAWLTESERRWMSASQGIPVVRRGTPSAAGARRTAAWALGVLGDDAAVDLLLSALSDEDDGVVLAAAEALESMIPKLAGKADAVSLAALKKCLHADCGKIRSDAIHALADIEGSLLPTDMTKAMTDSDWRVRFGAFKAIQSQGLELMLNTESRMEWSMWRYEPGRGAATPYSLADKLHLQWVRELPTPKRAWAPQKDDFDKLEFDLSYEPVASGNLLYVPSMVTDSLTAYAVESGEERWVYFTDGPVRVAPVVWNGKVYVASDDGYLHCMDARTGKLHWKFQGGPSRRFVLGNERLIDMWSARGGPVIQDGILYFAAGIWPLEGVFLYALDAETGAVRWANSGTGSRMALHPHGGAYAFGGVAPQGPFTIAGDKLIVPGGRTVPAVFDRHSGELLYFHYTTAGKGDGGYRVYASRDGFFNPFIYQNRLFSLETGLSVRGMDVEVLDAGGYFGVEANQPFAWISDKSGKRYWQSEGVENLEKFHLLAGQSLYGSGKGGRIFALDLKTLPTPKAELRWMNQVEGEVFRMLAAHGRLFVITEEGRIYCFGSQSREPKVHAYHPQPPSHRSDRWTARVEKLLRETNAAEGYALMFGIGSGRMLDELLRQSNLHVVVFDPDEKKVERYRERLTQAGWYGRRVAVHQGDAWSVRLPPYIASLIVSEDPRAAGYRAESSFVKALFHPLRPYGGAIYLPLSTAEQKRFADAVSDAALEEGHLKQGDDHILLTRPGALTGSDVWTHQYSDAANTNYSADSRVKAPMGIVWFGGPCNEKTLPRHMNGPIPQVLEGRLLILGLHHLSARCVYTGREIWSVELPLVGEAFTSLEHEAQPAPVYFPNHPGANFIGSPYVSTRDSVYIIHEDRCLRLALDTGRHLAVYELPDRNTLSQMAVNTGSAMPPASYASRIVQDVEQRWGYLATWGDYLIVGAYPHLFDEQQPGRTGNWNATSSEFLLAMNRHTGEINWVQQARYGFRHNAIATAEGRIFVIDNLSEEILSMLARRGIEPDTRPEIHALDLETGRVLWTYDDYVFGTWLAYSAEEDLLLQSGRLGGRGAPQDEPREQILMLRGRDGTELWRRSERHTGPVALHASLKRIIAGQNERSLDMLTGEPYMINNPISHAEDLWRFNRTYGCGTQNVSRYLITFRSGAAGYYDLYREGGTGNLSGFRSGCTNNMIPADGVLNAPDYTRSCSCSYQHQTSLALAHMPEVEMWTYNTLSDPEPGSIRQVGINFGAPGSRMEEGLLWVNYPAVRNAPTPSVPIHLDAGDNPIWFLCHAQEVQAENGGYPWVAASGVQGVKSIRMEGLVNTGDPARGDTYTVRLHFVEPESIEVGQRVFDVNLQGNKVLDRFDIIARTGGINRAMVAEFHGIRPDADNQLKVEFLPSTGSSRQPLICGMEIRLEEAE